MILYYFTFVLCNIYTLVLCLNPLKTESWSTSDFSYHLHLAPLFSNKRCWYYWHFTFLVVHVWLDYLITNHRLEATVECKRRVTQIRDGWWRLINRNRFNTVREWIYCNFQGRILLSLEEKPHEIQWGELILKKKKGIFRNCLFVLGEREVRN